MIPKFRAWMKSLKWMCDVTNISFDSKFLDICHQGDTERYTEMSVDFADVIFMQSTGLRDRNGVEIFEGDVVHAYDKGTSLIGVVEYFDNAYCIKSKNDIYNPLWTNAEHYEVIGNIYENNKLLEENK